MGEGEGKTNKSKVLPEQGYIEIEDFLAPIIEGRRTSQYGGGVVLEFLSADYDEMVRENITPIINAFIDDFVFQAQMPRGRYNTVHLDRILSRFLALVD